MISKESGEVIPACPFLSDEFRGISAIIWSSASILSFRYNICEDVEMVHNPMADNPLPLGLLSGVPEYWTVVSSEKSAFATYKIPGPKWGRRTDP